MKTTDILGFEIWCETEFLGRPLTQLVAQFRYWQEALEYKDYAVSRGKNVVIRTMYDAETTANVRVYTVGNDFPEEIAHPFFKNI